MVSNIGFGINATHTTEENKIVSDLPIFEITNLKHPLKIIVSTIADQYTYKHIYGISRPKNWYDKLYIPNKIKRLKNIIKIVD
jgi:hypothetical protein